MSESKGILSSTIQVAIAMFIIKLLGVAKQSIIAAACGATSETDAYFIATGVIISLCSVLFSAISISFLSMHTNRLVLEGRESSNNLINAVLRVFIPISICIAIVFAIGSPVVAKILAPSYQGEQLQCLITYIRILSLTFVFFCYYLIVNVLLETDKRFLPGKGQSFFQNLMVILAALLFYKKIGMSALIYAIVLAGVVQCVQITWSARNIFKPKLKIKKENEHIKKLINLSLPLLLGNAIYEINDIVDKQISSGLGHGNASVLTYGASINEIVTTLIIASVSTVLFSHYATWIAEGNKDKVGENLKVSLEYLVVLIMPIMVMCLVCGDYLVTILYGRGNFGETAIARTNSVVIGYALGFFFQAARANIVKVYYAFQDTRTPMINGAISVAANICMSLLFSRIFGVGGIALATSMAMLLVTLLLFPQIRKYLPGFSIKSSAGEYVKVLLAGICVGISACFLRRILHTGTIVSFLIMGCFVVGMYGMLVFIFKVKSVRILASRFFLHKNSKDL